MACGGGRPNIAWKAKPMEAKVYCNNTVLTEYSGSPSGCASGCHNWRQASSRPSTASARRCPPKIDEKKRIGQTAWLQQKQTNAAVTVASMTGRTQRSKSFPKPEARHGAANRKIGYSTSVLKQSHNRVHELAARKATPNEPKAVKSFSGSETAAITA
eukprot:CAMPEP_0117616996 /NCGR_PEP_ID=MMETSP0784-20121206/85369_1 /TAXON_ID=39447 /ORGANISM="" /LENGTH=157 /DNA_ID=CAMNT_0005420833 /DNA_START=166 /DNA_END=639 /DNA_ORIENTATION=+